MLTSAAEQPGGQLEEQPLQEAEPKATPEVPQARTKGGPKCSKPKPVNKEPKTTVPPCKIPTPKTRAKTLKSFDDTLDDLVKRESDEYVFDGRDPSRDVKYDAV